MLDKKLIARLYTEVMTRPGDYRGDPDDVSCYPEIRYSDPIFFDVIYSFTNLRNLNIGYEQPRKHPIIISAASDLSVGLGKYLISTSGAHLSQFKLQRVWPTDLKTLVLSLSDALPSQSQPNSKSASALTSTLKNPITNIQLPCLILEFTSDKEVYTSSAIATPLADLLAFTPHLEKLFLREPEFYYQPSLIAFRATPLPKLVEISLTNFRVDRGGMVSLLGGKEDLRELNMAHLALVGEGSIDKGWVTIKELVGLDLGKVDVWFLGLGCRDDDGWRRMTVEEEMAWGKKREVVQEED